MRNTNATDSEKASSFDTTIAMVLYISSRAGGCCAPMLPAPIHVAQLAQLVILNCMGLEIITVGKMGTSEVFVKDKANWS